MKKLLCITPLLVLLASCASSATRSANTAGINWPANAQPMLASRAVLDVTMP